MKDKSSFILILSVSIATSGITTPQALAQTPVNLVPPSLQETQDLLRACDKALSACDKTVKAQEELAKAHLEVISEQERSISHLKEEKDSSVRSNLLWFILGAALGGIVVGAATK